MHADVIVIGSGVAGLSVALAAAPRRVLLLSAGRLAVDGASHWAQGGIAAALGPGDSAELHAQDTLAAGAGAGDLAVIRTICAAAPEAITWLRGLGCCFDVSAGQLQLGREAAHSHARIVHADGDATGAEVMRTLAHAARRSPSIEVREGFHACTLLRDQRGRVVAVRGTDAQGRAYVFRAPVCVLATGGVGRLFAYTTNPEFAQGQGLQMAMQVGAELADLEFVQFHPTALRPSDVTDVARSGALPLLSEALRGAGAVLVNAAGERVMAAVEGGDLAARDVVARAVYAAHLEGGVWLDARTAIGSAFPHRFPAAFAACQKQGIDPRLQLIPVVPAAHYHMGGVRTDALGWSTLPGLAAVGEVACNGLHGANRLASNSLLEGLVIGRRLGAQLREMSLPRVSEVCPAPAESTSSDLAQLAVCIELRSLMWRAMGLQRNASDLRSALGRLQDIAVAVSATPSLGPLGLMAAMLRAALARPQSLGAHWRQDDLRQPPRGSASGCTNAA